jgi:hypothetical protein
MVSRSDNHQGGSHRLGDPAATTDDLAEIGLWQSHPHLHGRAALDGINDDILRLVNQLVHDPRYEAAKLVDSPVRAVFGNRNGVIDIEAIVVRKRLIVVMDMIDHGGLIRTGGTHIVRMVMHRLVIVVNMRHRALVHGRRLSAVESKT